MHRMKARAATVVVAFHVATWSAGPLALTVTMAGTQVKISRACGPGASGPVDATCRDDRIARRLAPLVRFSA